MHSALPISVAFLGTAFATASTSISLVDGVIFAIGLYVLFHILRLGNWRWIIADAVQVILILFSGAIILSILFLPYDQPPFGIITLYLIGLFFLSNYLSRNGFRNILLKGYVLGAFISALVSLSIFLIGNDTFLYHLVTQGDRLTFFFSDPNVYGAYLIPAFILSLATLVHKNETRSPNVILLAYGLISIGIFFAIAFTGSRGAYIQGVFAVVTFMWLERNRIPVYTFRTAMIGMLMLAAVSVYFLTIGNTFTNRLTASDIPRLENIDHAMSLLSERNVRTLFIGTGSGSYEAFSPTGFSAHNTFLRLLIENGILGLVLFLAILGAIVTLTFRYKKDIITHAVLSSIVGVLVHSVFIDTLHWRHFWLLLGLL